jgi:hypothetical protein
MARIASAAGIRRTEWLGGGGRSWLQPSELSKDVLWREIWLLLKCLGSDWHGLAWLRRLLLFLGKGFLRPNKLRSSGPWVMTTVDHQSGKWARVHRRFGFIALACSLRSTGTFLISLRISSIAGTSLATVGRARQWSSAGGTRDGTNGLSPRNWA